MCISLQPPWWADRLVIPGFFLVAGAAIGYFIDRLKAHFEEKKALKCFLRASRYEVAALVEEFTGLKADLLKSSEDLARGAAPTRWVLSLRTTVFDTQLGHLKDLSDPVIEKLVVLYSAMGILPGALQLSNDHADLIGRLARENDQALRHEKASLIGSLRALCQQLDELVKNGSDILATLPEKR